MKREWTRVLIFGTIISLLFPVLTLTSKSGESNKAAAPTDVYKKLYFARVASDTALNTAVLNRLAQGDLSTATNVLAFRLKHDIDAMNSETNYVWSEDNKKAKALAEEYLRKQNK